MSSESTAVGNSTATTMVDSLSQQRPVVAAQVYWLVVGSFSLATGLSALLSFSLQPMIAKMLLPRFGGTPAVWNATMVFFQTVLLVSYGYSYLLSKIPSVRRQVAVHVTIAFVALFSLPIGLRPLATGTPTAPALAVLLSLVVAVGTPFFVLGAAAPTLQQWFGKTGHPRAHDPYFLYVFSNAGSLGALVMYPIAVEPLLTLHQQSLLWSGGFLLSCAVTIGCALVFTRSARLREGSESSVAVAQPVEKRVNRRSVAKWLFLSFGPAGLLLAVTTYITTDLAAVPLLWVAPLGLYLLSFVVAFSRFGSRTSQFWLDGQLIAVVLVSAALTLTLGVSKLTLIPLHLAAFFTVCTACHLQLAKARPHPHELPAYYFWLAMGGLLGGLVNVFLWPIVFTSAVEYPLMLVALCMLRPKREAQVSKDRWADVLIPAAALLGLVILFKAPLPASWPSVVPYATFVAVAILCTMMWNRPVRLSLTFGAWFLTPVLARPTENLLLGERNFFGVYRVREQDGFHALYHGTTLHGAQRSDTGSRTQPLTYYHEGGPLGTAFAAIRSADKDLRVAVVGLGTGTVACYGRLGERWTFIELDPFVEKLARDTTLFTYLRDCPPHVSVTVSDGRLALERSRAGEFDLILLDAFSSDAIPVHFLTREAFQGYRKVLARDGFLLLHLSNRYLDLLPVVAASARATGQSVLVGRDESARREGPRPFISSSVWMAVFSDPSVGALLSNASGWKTETVSSMRPWTDSYSNLVGALK